MPTDSDIKSCNISNLISYSMKYPIIQFSNHCFKLHLFQIFPNSGYFI